ncbi:hypothetical protein DPX16_15542 [Anabarilius grahami]|uniref:Tyr recombinase domain-containing protein n=1 Tax=Anabarilius grahami TaxID=495550 RepID=A0A3N0YIK3_ANAGA|nr:hypothetical protein DPX16_15542 [Anabarilius grahami]
MAAPPRNLQDLKDLLLILVPDTTFRGLVESMPRRVSAVLAASGGQQHRQVTFDVRRTDRRIGISLERPIYFECNYNEPMHIGMQSYASAARLAARVYNEQQDGPSLAHSSEEGPSFSETGHSLAPASRPLETPCLVPGRDAEVLGDLPPEVLNTITSARAPSTRRAYALKWNLFVEWCSSHREDPRRCSIGVVLSFLQQGLERRLSPSTLKVHTAAISAYHDHIDGKSVGQHDLVVRFLRGARRLNPPRPPSIPSWDLALVLRALKIAPFEPLQSADLKILSMKTLLLVALASIKRVGDLQSFSVDESCLEFGPGDSHVVLRPRPGYVPKVPTTPFRDQVVSLQALPSEEADPALALLCPVRALRLYIDRTQSVRTSDQLFVCYGGQQKGKAVSKQRMAHWIVDAIALAYQAQGLPQGVPCPLRLHAHSTRGVASSWALARGASLTDICRAAGWATPNTFARYYSLRVEPVSSRVLASGQRHGEAPG